MATQYAPIAKDSSINTTENTPRNIADVLAEELSAIEQAIAGGSGSGGHTIVNASGTDMTQRAKMQFVDAEVTDDAVNDVTKISTTPASYPSANVTYGSGSVEDALDDVNDELTTKYIKCRFVEQTVTFPANTSNISISFATELADIDSSSILTIIGVNIGSFGFPYIGNDGYTIIYSINKGTKTVVVNNTAGAWANYKFRCLVFYT